MRKLCCVLNRVMLCDDCKNEVCAYCIRIWNATYVANRNNKRGIEWLCNDCFTQRSKENEHEAYV